MTKSVALEAANADVTKAIFEAEDVLYKAIKAWKVVEHCEQIIADLSDASELEKKIANHGAGFAGKNVVVLQALLGKGGP